MADEPKTDLEVNPDLENHHTPPDPDASDALDRALLQATEGEVPEGVKIDQKIADEAAAKAAEEAKKVEDAAKADEARQAEEAAKKAAEADPNEAAKKAAAEAEAQKAKEGSYDSVALPPYAKPATTEAFSKVKAMAKQEIERVSKEAAELRAKNAEYEAKLKDSGKLPEEVEKELSELREFRAKLDVEADPKFKEWDVKVSENVQSIYAKLRTVGTAEEVIKKIEAMGGPAEIDWDAMSDKMPPSAKRYIEGKLFENEDLTDKKRKALDEAKSKATEYVKSRAESLNVDQGARKKAVESKVAELSPKVEWINDRKAATAEEKQAVEAHNKRAAEIRATMREAIDNDTPEMKSLLILGIAQLQRVNGEFETFKATAAAEKAALEKELTETKTLLEKIKRAGKSRLGAAPAPGEVSAKVKLDYSEDSSDALDRHYKEAQARAAKE